MVSDKSLVSEIGVSNGAVQYDRLFDPRDNRQNIYINVSRSSAWSPMYDTILYPTDGSNGASAALEQALGLAQRYDATVHVLFVVDSEHVESGMVSRKGDRQERVTGMMKRDEKTVGEGSMSRNEDLADVLERRGHQLIDETASRLAEAGCETTTIVREGDPVQVITDYAEDNDIDLITMGTHGRRGVKRRLIGSVTENVVRTSKVPVLTVRLDKADQQP